MINVCEFIFYSYHLIYFLFTILFQRSLDNKYFLIWYSCHQCEVSIAHWHSLQGLSSVSWNWYFGRCLKHPGYDSSNVFFIFKITWWCKHCPIWIDYQVPLHIRYFVQAMWERNCLQSQTTQVQKCQCQQFELNWINNHHHFHNFQLGEDKEHSESWMYVTLNF